MMKISVRYSCVMCGLLDVPVSVPARPDTMDVRVWMDGTIGALSADHQARSPDCHPKELQNVKIPIDGAEWIGGPAIQ